MQDQLQSRGYAGQLQLPGVIGVICLPIAFAPAVSGLSNYMLFLCRRSEIGWRWSQFTRTPGCTQLPFTMELV